MATAGEFAATAFRNIECSAVPGALFQVCYDGGEMRIGRAGTGLSIKFEKKKPDSIVGYYDDRASSAMIAADLIATGCHA